MLGECRRKPTRKRVHLLRVSTLRLQAQVGYWLEGHESDHPSASIAKHWNREAKHLRRALGAVRAFDVHLGKLSLLRDLLTTESGYEPRSSRESLRQIDVLEERFKRDRRSATKDLEETLEERHGKLERTAKAMAAEPTLHPVLQTLTLHRLWSMFADAASGFSKQNPDSLHDFRKRLKSVRYLTELAPASEEVLQLASTVRAMQGAIGEWHDWEELSIYAARVLRRKETADLSQQLETLIAESLERALTLCENASQQLPAAQQIPPLDDAIQKKPVRTDKDATVHIRASA
jgi:CHAD domain-containing protein